MSKSVNFVKLIIPVAFAIVLSACGGSSGADFGSGTGTGTNPVPGTSIASTISLTASSRQLFSSGSDPVVISATAKDANNNVLSDAIITFSVDMNANILVDGATGSVKTANLTPGSKENRTITVTASSAGVSETLEVAVVGTNLQIEGPSNAAINKANEYTIKLLDSSDGAIAFEDVTVTSAIGNTITPISPSTFTTDGNGQLIISLAAATGGTDTISANALNATIDKTVEISGSDFTLSGTATNGELNIATLETITVQWLINGLPQAGENIAIRTTRGTLNNSTVTTGPNGEATFTITSAAAGESTITAESDTGLIATLEREFVAITPDSLNSQAVPSLISTNETSRIISIVRDVNNNPVKNTRVNFNLTDNVNGTLSNSSATTNSLGRAEVVYSSSDSASSFEGVEILTSLQDFPLITDLTKLTVRGNTSRIVLGSDELVAQDGVFYTKTFGVIVTDNAGNPSSNQQVDFTIAPATYVKGAMFTVDTSSPPDGTADEWQRIVSVRCPIEDFNRDGNLDNGEDINGNGTLEPTNDATISATGVTDAEGKMSVTVIYPQSAALWSTQLITATVAVGGTEFVENTIFNMDILLADINDPDSSVPNELSPYGQSASCSDPD
ncbi:MAG: Ig-like domain-containing protein [Cocleimonas sp.]